MERKQIRAPITLRPMSNLSVPSYASGDETSFRHNPNPKRQNMIHLTKISGGTMAAAMVTVMIMGAALVFPAQANMPQL